MFQVSNKTAIKCNILILVFLKENTRPSHSRFVSVPNPKIVFCSPSKEPNSKLSRSAWHAQKIEQMRLISTNRLSFLFNVFGRLDSNRIILPAISKARDQPAIVIQRCSEKATKEVENISQQMNQTVLVDVVLHLKPHHFCKLKTQVIQYVSQHPNWTRISLDTADMTSPAQNEARSIRTLYDNSTVWCGGCCYMTHKCAMKNLQVRTLFYIFSVGAAQLPQVCTHSDRGLSLQSHIDLHKLNAWRWTSALTDHVNQIKFYSSQPAALKAKCRLAWIVLCKVNKLHLLSLRENPIIIILVWYF